jgi:hypothetical protein
MFGKRAGPPIATENAWTPRGATTRRSESLPALPALDVHGHGSFRVVEIARLGTTVR